MMPNMKKNPKIKMKILPIPETNNITWFNISYMATLQLNKNMRNFNELITCTFVHVFFFFFFFSSPEPKAHKVSL